MKDNCNLNILLFIIAMAVSSQAHAQSAIGQLETMSGGKVSRSSSLSSATMNSMVTGAILQSLFSSMLSNPAAGQKEDDARKQAARMEEIKAAEKAAEQQKIKEAIARAEYEKMMQSYKLLDDAQDFRIKTLDSQVEYKTLDRKDNPLSETRDQPEPASSAKVHEHAEGFFGDQVSSEDLMVLLDINNNPAVADLRDADRYLDENSGRDSTGIVSFLRKHESDDNGEPVITIPDCIRLRDQLKGYLDQREQFRKTIDLSESELNIWETANNDAMLNAAKDGLDYFTGELLQGMEKRAQAADRLQQVYNCRSKQMAGEGINISEIQAKIEKLRSGSSAAQISELTTDVKDWDAFAKDGLTRLISRLSESNKEINLIMEAPGAKKYFDSVKQEINTLLDISKLSASGMVFEKWVAKKIPVIAVMELSIKQTYNGMDYLLSLNRIIEARKINGGVLNAAKYIQKNIDDTFLALAKCR